MKNCVAAIFLSLFLLPSTVPLASDTFSLRAGMGYEVVSQRFFLDSLLTSGADSLDALTSQNTTYLDDYKTFIIAEVTLLDRRRWDLRFQPELTSDYLRLRLYSDNRLALGKHTLQINNELDRRDLHHGQPEAGDEYTYGAIRSRLNLNLGERTTQFWQARGSFVQFDSAADYNYNHYRLSGDVGVSRSFADFSSLSGYLFAGTRQVADSTDQNYRNFGAELDLFAFYTGGDLDLSTRLERKDYNRPVGEDDFTRWEVIGTNTLEVSSQVSLRQQVDMEFVSFSDSDLINPDYFRGKFRGQAGRIGDVWKVWLGPELEYLTEATTEYTTTSEDYLELGLQVDFDLLLLGKLFAAVGNSFGRRGYIREDGPEPDTLFTDPEIDFSLTDFYYERLSLLGDWKLSRSIGFNVLLSAEWEWHETASDNSRLVLFSSALTYRF